MRKLALVINISAMVYLGLPVILFAFGWLKIYYAIGLSILLFLASLLYLKTPPPKTEDFRPQLTKVLVIVAIILCWVGLSGIGGFSFQNSDHTNRNATLRDLVQYEWPVIYDYTHQKGNSVLAGHKGALIYYLAFWLPAAFVGKLLGWNAANIALYIWTVIGVFIAFYYMSTALKKISVLMLLGFIFWSGLDFIGCFILRGMPYLGQHLEWWARYFQYSSETTLLFWVFNQAVPVWVIVMLLINQKNNKSLIFLYALCIPYAPFPFIGLTPFIFYWAFFKPGLNLEADGYRPEFTKKTFLANFRSLITFQNIIVPIVILMVFYMYFSSNSNNVPHNGLVGSVNGPRQDLFINYFLFCLFEFGIYTIAVYGKFKKDPFFWMTIGVLTVIPFYNAGIYNDFTMRASIPALLILLLYVTAFLKKSTDRSRNWVLVIILILAGLTAGQEIYRSIYRTHLNYSHRLADRGYTFGILESLAGIDKFVVADPQKKLFFKYFGK